MAEDENYTKHSFKVIYICMDNAAYHIKVLDAVPKQYDTKKM